MRIISATVAALIIPVCFAQTSAPPAALKVGNAIAAQFEDGPPLGSLHLVPGEVVYFSFTVENFTKSPTRKVSLTGHIQVFDPTGVSIFPADEIPLMTTLSEEDKNYRPKLRSAIAIPPIARRGTYKVKYD